MSKAFNTTGTCFPAKHYMVDLSGRLEQIARMVDAGRYFCINRARQYGKSTVIYGLSRLLAERYIVFSLSFQRMSAAKFRDEDTFCRAFISRMQQSLAIQGRQEPWPEYMDILAARAADFHRPLDLTDMFDDISLLCSHSPRPVILIIDEVDNACNNQIFVDFLGQLRDLYLNRELTPTFQSVILAGVYNVKNLRLKEGSDSGTRYNSPWNIADDFTMDMRFHPEDIAGMLREYESERHTGMDITSMSRMIFDYTDGYPYMVSRLCKLLDERIPETDFVPRKDIWTKEGLLAAIRLFLKEPNTLFEDMVKKLDEYPDLKEKISDILFRGTKYTFEIDSRFASIGCMFGFLKEDQGFVAIANRLFETKLYNLLLAESEGHDEANPTNAKSQFIVQGMLQMDLVMQKFYQYFQDIFAGNSDKFIKEEGRRIFLMFLRPIINGTGNYYIEAQTRDKTRTDVVVDFRGRQFVIELKLWYGQAYLQRGETQLFEYLEAYGLQRGYLLSFNFNKRKQTGIKEIIYGNRQIMEVTV